MSERPAGRVTGAVAVVAAVVAFLLTGVDTVATLVGFGSVLALVAALRRSNRPLVTLAGLGLFGAVLLAGAGGASPESLVSAGVAVLLAWTFAQSTVDLRESVGRARSRDAELAHVAGTTALAAGLAAPVYLVYTVDWGDLPTVAAALLVIGAVSLTAGLRR